MAETPTAATAANGNPSPHRLISSIVDLASLPATNNQQQHLLSCCLRQSIQICQSQRGRTEFASLPAIPLLLSVFPKFASSLSSHPLPASTPPLLSLLHLLFKLLRNLCAGEASNQNAFLDGQGVEAVATSLQTLAAFPKRLSQVSSESEDHKGANLFIDITMMALQLLGNLCGGGEAHAQAVWKRLFPSLFLRLAATGQEKILDPLSMILYSCCRMNKARLRTLCHGEGALLMSKILTEAIKNAAGDWLQLLVSHICFREPFLPLLFTNLGDASQAGPQETYTLAQAFLLENMFGFLNEELEKDSRQLDAGDQSAFQMAMPAEAISFIAKVIRQASRHPKVGDNSLKKLPTRIPSIDVLGYALGIIRILSIWEFDDGNRLNYQWKRDLSIVSRLSSCGVIQLCLKLLEELGPPELIRKYIDQEAKKDTVFTGSEGKGDGDKFGKTNLLSAHVCIMDEHAISSSIPYEGYRRDLLAIIGNAAYQNRAAQDEVRQLGGLFLILQQCISDKESPFLREWGIWAIRNLLEGNDENRRELADMELKGTFTPQELVQIGLKVEINPETGRPRIANVNESFRVI